MKCKTFPLPSFYQLLIHVHHRSFFAPENRLVTLKLIRYSMYMILFPLATFYISFYIYFEQNPEMLGWSGIFAVVAANVVIAAYVIMAWNEDEDDKNEARAKAKKLHLQSAKKES
jgi:hypothetical protein